MKSIGIRQADGSFYPILEEGQTSKKTLGLTTAKDNQTRVIVDMYRSADGNMDEAEYVDSLQIDNLVEHPNGSAEIRLNIGLDENGKLTAELIDPETGATSNANITLVSRTLEERLGTTSDDTGAFAAGAAAGAVAAAAGGGLLKAAMEKEDSEEAAAEETTEIPEGEESFDLPSDETFAATEESEEENLDLPSDEPVSDEMPSFDLPDSEPAAEETVDLDLPDFENDTVSAEETASETMEEQASDDSGFELPDFDTDVTLPSFDESEKNDGIAEAPADETVATETAEESVSFDLPEESAADETVSFDLPESEPVVEETSDFDLPDFENDTVSSEETTEDTFDLPDFDTTPSKIEETTVTSESEPASSDDDFNFDFPEADSSDSFATESTETETASESTDLGFDFPAFGSDPADTSAELSDNDDIFGDSSFLDDIPDEPAPDSTAEMIKHSSALQFDGLYDKETIEGSSSDFDEEEEDVSKKTKIPMIICIICAIICVIATLLILFVVPSKYNLLNKHPAEKDAVVEEIVEAPAPVVEPEPEPEPEPEIVEAKEDEIVVVEEPEKVVPEPPKEPEVKPEDITYKIKWGDTLWDIADAYYKNPWNYKKIARYNGIRNPDYIISGTYIKIPAK